MERQIQTFEEARDAIIGPSYVKRTPSDFELLIIFKEAEYVMNYQPLGRFFGEEDQLQVLRPLDLMIGFMVPIEENVTLDDAIAKISSGKVIIILEKLPLSGGSRGS